MPTEPASAPSHAPEALDRPDATVACGACRTCCTGTNVALFTGDDLDLYEHKAWLHDINPETDAFYRSHDPAFAGYVLKRDATNTCVYMTEAGCSIYHARPIACRSYSCLDTVRRIFSIPKDERDAYREIARSQIFREGLIRLHAELFPPRE